MGQLNAYPAASRMRGPPRLPGDQSLRGQAAAVLRPDGKRMFFDRTNSRSVSTAFSPSNPLPFTPPNGEPRQARRV